MDQNTQEWLEWRKNGIGASDLPVIMGDSPYKTAHQLWLEKTGRHHEENSESKNFILNKGHEVEVIARNRYEIETGCTWKPILAEHEKFPHFRASLDGYNKERNACWECKYIGKEGFEEVKSGKIPAKYKAQVQWQMFITGATENHFSVMNDEQEMVSTIEKADIDYIRNIVNKASEFWNFMQLDIEPPFSKMDKVQIDNEKLIEKIHKYNELEQQIKQLKSEQTRVKSAIFKAIPHTNCNYEGEEFKANIQVQDRAGSVDNAALYEHFKIPNEEVEKFRKPSTETKVIRITKVKK